MNKPFLMTMIVIVLCLAASFAVAVSKSPPSTLPAGESPEAPALEGPFATRVVLFEADQEVMRLDPVTGVPLLLSPERVIRPAAAAAKLHDPALAQMVDATVTCVGSRPSAGVYALDLTVRVSPRDSELVESFADQVRERAEKVLCDWGQEELEALSRERNVVITQMDNAVSRIRTIRESELAEATENLDVLPTTEALKLMNDLKAERFALSMTLETENARQDTISQKINSLRTEAEKIAQTDPMLAELQKLVTLREEALQNAQQRRDAGRLAGDDFRTFQEKLAEAKIGVLRRQEELTKAAAGNLLPELTRELTMLQIGLREKERREILIQRQLEDLAKMIKNSSGQIASSDIHSKELEVLMESFSKLYQQRERLDQLLSRGQPVRLVGKGTQEGPTTAPAAPAAKGRK